MTETAGIDFGYAHPGSVATAQCGYRFVLGYLSNSPGKNMTQALAQAYLSAGLAVGLVWETLANRVLSGAAGGTVDGATAEAQANAIGYPKNSPIFFAVDYAEPANDFPACQAYAAAFNSKISRPTGIYGDYNVIEHFVTPGIQPVQFGWQTVAWSGGAVSGKAHIYQRNSHHWPIIPGVRPTDFDEDILMKACPLWGMQDPAPSPTPAPPSPPPPPPPPPIFDVRNWRPVYGVTDPHVQNLQAWGNHNYPAYCNINPTDPHYGPKTVAFVREFAKRSGIVGADGMNIGPQISNALANAGFPG